MVELQDVANVALVISVAVTIYLALYGPFAKRRELVREIRTKLGQELRSAKIAARSRRMDQYIGHLGTWTEHGQRLPRRIRREVGPFYDLCQRYWDKCEEATKIVQLAAYESMARSALKAAKPVGTGSQAHWIILGPLRQRSAKESFEEALIDILSEPLLRGEKLRWGMLVDTEPDFTGQLVGAGVDPIAVNTLIEGIEGRLAHQEETFSRLREIKDRIRDYRFRYFPEAE